MRMKGTVMRCDNCKFWRPVRDPYDLHPDDRPGNCRRYPPKLDLSEQAKWESSEDSGFSGYSYLDYRYWNFPVVEGAEWCGEFVKA